MSWSLTPTPFKKEKIKHDVRTFVLDGTGKGTWTPKVIWPAVFKTAAYADSATPAYAAPAQNRTEIEWLQVTSPTFSGQEHNAAYIFDYINRSLYKNWVFFLLWTIH